MSISGGQLDSLLNEIFSVDTGYFGVNLQSGTETGAYPNYNLTTATVNTIGQAGPGTEPGDNETVTISTVNDGSDLLGLTLTSGANRSLGLLNVYVVGAGANGSLLVSVAPSSTIGLYIAQHLSLSTLSSDIGILSATPIPSGTTLTFGGINPPLPLSISGTVADQTTIDTGQAAPFAGVTIADPNGGQTDTATVTLSAAANGILTNLGGGSYNISTGVYTISGTAASIATALGGLVFTPTPGLTPPGQAVTTTFTIHATDTAGASATDNTSSVVTTSTLLGSLTADQQIELIYIAYFNRAGDGGGDTFWEGQNANAQSGGQSAPAALTNIANSFTPQPETVALYPFLGTTNVNLNTPAAQAGLSTFINSVYANLFGHAPDSAGKSYWVGQITNGTVGLGAAALAIANGATGSDATEVRNKVSVALDFTTRTAAAGLGETAPYPASYVTAAHTALNGVDGTSLNDPSVTAAENATTTYISGGGTGQQSGGAVVRAVADVNLTGDNSTTGLNAGAVAGVTPITVAVSDQAIDPGEGSHTIQFLGGISGDTLVLHAGGVDQVSGFDPASDVLDLRSLLAGLNVNLTGGFAALSNYLTIADQGSDAVVRFDPAGQGGGSVVAVLQGLGNTVAGLDSLVAQHAIRIA